MMIFARRMEDQMAVIEATTPQAMQALLMPIC